MWDRRTTKGGTPSHFDKGVTSPARQPNYKPKEEEKGHSCQASRSNVRNKDMGDNRSQTTKRKKFFPRTLLARKWGFRPLQRKWKRKMRGERCKAWRQRVMTAMKKKIGSEVDVIKTADHAYKKRRWYEAGSEAAEKENEVFFWGVGGFLGGFLWGGVSRQWRKKAGK